MRSRFLSRQSVWGVVLVTALAYLLFTLAALGLHGCDPLWFAWLGERYMAGVPDGSIGYDGQFVYAIAIEGLEAVPLLDNPPYRLQRILLPLLVGLLSGGRPQVVAWAIPLVNGAAIVLGGYLLGRWLMEQGLSPWYALTYTGFVGTLMAYSRNVIEPLMGLLVIAAVIAWQRERLAQAALWLALAMLAKEIALLFGAGLALDALVRRRFRPLGWLVVGAAPLLLWQVALYRWFGVLALRAGPGFDPVPLRGILGQLTWEPGRLSALLSVALPALALAAYVLWKIVGGEGWRHGGATGSNGQLGLWLVMVHAVTLLFLPAAVYDHLMHAGRNAIGLVVAVVFAMPGLTRAGRRLALAYWLLPSLAWLVPILRWSPWS